MRTAVALSAILIFFSAATLSARAHEFWVEPEKFHVSSGESVIAALQVGDNFEGLNFPYLSDRFVSFTKVDTAGSQSVAGNEGDDPAAQFSELREGLNAVVYHSTGDIAEFMNNWDLFKKYLKHEGLDWVIDAHKKQGLPTDQISEIYHRCAKALIQVGPVNDASGSDKLSGMPYEFVFIGNPYAQFNNNSVRVQLFWDQKPAADAQIKVFRFDDALDVIKLRTNSQGIATVPVRDGGRFLLSSVHMQEGPRNDGHAWESHWASLTFELNSEKTTSSLTAD